MNVQISDIFHGLIFYHTARKTSRQGWPQGFLPAKTADAVKSFLRFSHEQSRVAACSLLTAGALNATRKLPPVLLMASHRVNCGYPGKVPGENFQGVFADGLDVIN
ncbi:MAG: hypothetical protein K9K81_00240 [Desulfobacteraceae bacterium]|nr:hypothetical protein [Desulfobacteraceae bacterium]